MKKWIVLLIHSLAVLLFISCSSKDLEADTEMIEVEASSEDYVIEEYNGDPVKTYDVIYTLDEVLSLTFDRILPKDVLIPLLDELDEHDIKV